MRTKQRVSASKEYAAIDLGDARRSERARRMAQDLASDPSRAFPKVFPSTAELEAAYRLLGNEAVTMDALMAGHITETVKRASSDGAPPLLVIDKTEFTFGGESDREGLERRGPKRQGFDAFCGLAVSSSSRMPLGVLAIDADVEPGRTGAAGWQRAIEAALPPIAELAPIVVADREADAYELFVWLVSRGHRFVIRAAGDRLVQETPAAESEPLGDISRRAPMMLDREVKLSRRSGVGKAPAARRKHPPREGRAAKLAVSARSIVLPRPSKLSRDLPASLALQVIRVSEIDPPAGQAPVDWLLFTNLPCTDATGVAFAVDCYRGRWVIEEYFKALKTGCAYEKRQLESKHALLNALGLLVPLAWRLLALRNLARTETAPASAILKPDEIHVLRHLSIDVKLGKHPTAAEALLAVASIGGHIRNNGNPGWMTLWSGFQRLYGAVEGYRVARAEM